jgi:hypothetical protein
MPKENGYRRQAQRILDLPLFRDVTTSLLREYEQCLAACCRSEGVAQMVADELIATATTAPLPVDIRRCAAMHNPSDHPEGCQTCGDYGYTSGTYLLTYRRNQPTICEQMSPGEAREFYENHREALKVEGQMIYDGAQPCPACTLGRMILAGPPDGGRR